MKESQIIDFVKQLVAKKDIDFCQYIKKDKIEHLGGSSVEDINSYHLDNIVGISSLKNASELEPTKMIYELAPEVYLTYELGFCQMDWMNHAKFIQIGLVYYSLHIKLYEFIFGYPKGNVYNKPDYELAQKKGDIYYSLNACANIFSVLNKVDWKNNAKQEEFLSIPFGSLVSHQKETNSSKVLNLFIKDDVLMITDFFCLVMQFSDKFKNLVDVRSSEFSSINFLVEYPLEKTFLLKNFLRVQVNFKLSQKNVDFLLDNKNLIFGDSEFENDKPFFRNLKFAWNAEQKQKNVLVIFKDDVQSSCILSDMWTTKEVLNLVRQKNKIKVGKKIYNYKQFLNHISVIELSFEQHKFIVGVGEKFGDISWFENLTEEIPVQELVLS